MRGYKVILFQITLCLVTTTLVCSELTTAGLATVREDSEDELQDLQAVPKNRIKVKVYYETLCQASIEYFKKTLVPAVEQLETLLDVHLVPYGHAKTRSVRGRYRFTCQHGPAECYGNQLHACHIHTVRNSTKAVLVTNCLMQSTPYKPHTGYDFPSAFYWCSYLHDVDTESVKKCMAEDGARILKEYGEETDQLNPSYVPYVLVGNSIGELHQTSGNLISTACSMLHPTPPECYNY